MKYLAVLILFCNIAFANPIRVEGIGNTLQQAKDNAFKTAVELQVGFVIVNELESKDNKLTRNDIINYSAGYVDSYKIISTNTYDNKVVVIVDVNVSSSKIADRILGTSTDPKLFDNVKHSTQYETYVNSKHKGDKLLTSVLNDYPRKAFTVTQSQHKFGVDVYRNAFIEISFQLKWNYNYIVSFNEALSLLEDGSNGLLKPSPANIVVMAKDPKDYVLGKKTHFKFNDVFTFDTVKQRFDENIPKLQLTIYNQNNSIFYKKCYTPDSFTGRKPGLYSMGDTLIVYGNQTENNIIRIHLSNTGEALRFIERLELNVVGNESCK
jgi:hypothetical protein